ncbi:hypothetical protein QEG98_41925 (plasmid) [Myxococcus sp. MxC21-1]|uniref:hypothetical protein n=1 Tax=Myxococcus sp. MxC21-1 TaxID=3041439 RepID=UPI0029308386|nr:hypothetical protein [Myxococcus sp. MxC21-1]WNZ66228.1 hypothetical protein QEG98_41925 [Myxococcus sp. MxC21-1]
MGTGEITTRVDVYFNTSDCNATVPDPRNDYGIILDKAAGPSWLVATGNTAWVVGSARVTTYRASVRRADTGECEQLTAGEEVYGFLATPWIALTTPEGVFDPIVVPYQIEAPLTLIVPGEEPPTP